MKNSEWESAKHQQIPLGEKVELFDGESLSGWKTDIPKADEDPSVEPSFIVRDGNLVSLGSPKGHLVTKQKFSNYKLVVEYRFPGKPGNCGVLVHASTPRVLYDMFPKSIEVQMQHKHAGDFWCIGEDITVPNMVERRPLRDGQSWGGLKGDARHIHNLTDGSEKPLKNWNRMEIVCKDDEIAVWVNGELVNYGYDCTVKRGSIAIQAEGSEVEFRRIDLYLLTGVNPFYQ